MGWFVAVVVWYVGGFSVCLTALMYEHAQDRRPVTMRDLRDELVVYLALSLMGPALVWFIWKTSKEGML